ncbi:lens fiber major intrinsic protein-like isoform X2 [Dendronephthya gigantea]|uniref:lens fiber major intrinsic protein-like isoform X2 n=1 Tax=Dendronephthya gigantea TaxID=151771 RepID=UPI00106B1D1D|nr:lens fiber major intrinsic protein-like isoform X2 [Dendronephthya gigantea]
MLPQEEKPPSEFRMKKFWASIAAEYLGTGLLVYIATSVCNVSDTNLRDNTKASGNLECALANGLGVATIVHWTEGLLNPALAVAFTSTGKLSLTKGVLLIIMEIVGGISGAALTYALTPSRLRHTLGDTVLHEDMSTMQGLFVEFILTLILTLAVYATRDAGRKCEGYHSSLAYGFAVVSCYLVGYQSSTIVWSSGYSGNIWTRKTKRRVAASLDLLDWSHRRLVTWWRYLPFLIRPTKLRI